MGTSNNIARWDGAAWRGVDKGVLGEVLAIHRVGDGLVVAGFGPHYPYIRSALVAYWGPTAGSNERSWQRLAGSGELISLTDFYDASANVLGLHEGHIFVGGSFSVLRTQSGDQASHRIARFALNGLFANGFEPD
jgi:hypothetical protein